LDQRQLGSGLVEVSVRRGLDAVSAIAEINVIEVQLENLVLAERSLHLACHARFHDLAAQAAFLIWKPLGKEVAGELLRDGASTFGHATRADVCQQSARGAAKIDPTMIVETLILDRDECLRNVLRKRVE